MSAPSWCQGRPRLSHMRSFWVMFSCILRWLWKRVPLRNLEPVWDGPHRGPLSALPSSLRGFRKGFRRVGTGVGGAGRHRSSVMLHLRWAILRPCWGLCCPILELCWAYVGPSWVFVGAMLGHFGALLGPRRPIPGGHLGAMLGVCWPILALCWGPCWTFTCPPRGSVGSCWFLDVAFSLKFWRSP